MIMTNSQFPTARAAAHQPDGLVPIDRILWIMETLLDRKHGCEWSLQQDFASIAPYTIEEAYEVADAIEDSMEHRGGNSTAIRDELGDLLLQIIFHSQIAKDSGLFDFDDVASAIANKMQRRYPHIFGSEAGIEDDTTDPNESRTMNRTAPRLDWESIKAAERAEKLGGDGALAGVAQALPALMRAEKLQKRAARVGFDWPDISGARDKILEEMSELAQAKSPQEVSEEAGDLLFSTVNFLRHMGLNTEQVLYAANKKFERRFAAMEKAAGGSIDGLTLEQQEALWKAAKLSA